MPGNKMIKFIIKFIPSGLLSAQAKKPTGIIGRYLMTQIFNSGNADLNTFVKEELRLKQEDRVLEIGFGTGKLINEMASITIEGCVEGIDFSRDMFNHASKVNQQEISLGRVCLHLGDCSILPFNNEAFNKLCSINTLYFWKEPETYLKEIFRVTKTGGIAVIGFRVEEQMSKMNLDENVFRYFSQREVATLLSNAGFSEVTIKEKDGKPFVSYCAVAKKA
jgi:SAM-dependent methyltransferase